MTEKCPCCGDTFGPGHSPMTITYECDCGETWEGDWCSACDDECPSCGETVGAASWSEWPSENGRAA